VAYNFLLDQDNPQKICADRTSSYCEIFEPNCYYGNESILLRYAGFRGDESIKAVIEHGVPIDDSIWDAETHAQVNSCLTVTARRGQLLSKNSGKFCVPIGFSFLYAIENFISCCPVDSLNISRVGTVVLPAHSSQYIIADFDYESYADELTHLPSMYHPIVVCMYWKDFLLEKHNAFLLRGLPVVSAGNMYDNLFQYRLYDICRQFKYATSNIVGTHVFSSVKAGCSFFFTSQPSCVSYSNPVNAPLEPNPSIPNEIEVRAYKLFKKSVNYTTLEQIKFVNSLMGASHFRGRKEMRAILRLLDIYDKLPSLASGAMLGPRFLLPPFLHRRFSRLVRRFHRNGD